MIIHHMIFNILMSQSMVKLDSMNALILILMIKETGGKMKTVGQNIDLFVKSSQVLISGCLYPGKMTFMLKMDQEIRQILKMLQVDVIKDGGNIMELVTDHSVRI